MTRIERSALVPYTAQAMFDLVADIDHYGEFLPWCSGARVLSREGPVIVASIHMAYRGLNRSFTTRNVLTPGERMDLTLVDGPFRTLEGHWRFQPLDHEASKIALDLRFEFSNWLLEAAMGPIFGGIANSLVDSFRERAVAVHGPRDPG